MVCPLHPHAGQQLASCCYRVQQLWPLCQPQPLPQSHHSPTTPPHVRHPAQLWRHCSSRTSSACQRVHAVSTELGESSEEELFGIFRPTSKTRRRSGSSSGGGDAAGGEGLRNGNATASEAGAGGRRPKVRKSPANNNSLRSESPAAARTEVTESPVGGAPTGPKPQQRAGTGPQSPPAAEPRDDEEAQVARPVFAAGSVVSIPIIRAKPAKPQLGRQSDANLGERFVRPRPGSGERSEAVSGTAKGAGLPSQRAQSRGRPSRADDRPDESGTGQRQGQSRQKLSHRERVHILTAMVSEIPEILAPVFAAVPERRAPRDAADASIATMRQELPGACAKIGALFDADIYDAVCISTVLHRLGALADRLTDLRGESWGLGELKRGGAGALVQRVLGLARRMDQTEFKLRAIANSVWGLAKLQFPVDAALLDSWGQRAVLRFTNPPEPKAQEVSNLMWGCAKLGYSPLGGVLFDTALKHTLLQKEWEAGAQAVSNMLYATALLGHPVSKEHLDILAERARAVLREAPPQSMANTLWAFATIGYNPLRGQLLADALEVAQASLGKYTIQNLSNMVWAITSLEAIASSEFLAAVAQVAPGKLDGAIPQNLSNLLWGFGRQHFAAPALFDAGLKKALEMLPRMSSQELANLLLALGMLQHYPPRSALHAFKAAMLQRLEAAEPQHVCNTLWALAALDCLEVEDLRVFLAGLHRKLTVQEHSTEQLRQLMQADLAARGAAVGARGGRPPQGELPPSLLPRALLQRGRDQLLTHRTDDERNGKTVSSLQLDIRKALDALKLDYEMESLALGGLMRMDFKVKPRGGGGDVAVEVDGPRHFLRNARRANGRTTLRNRLLTIGGYRVVCITYFEWQEMKDDADRRAFLASRIAQSMGVAT